MLAFLAAELNAQRLFQGFSQPVQSGQFYRLLDAQARFSGVRSQQPGQVFRFNNGRGVGQGTLEELLYPFAMLAAGLNGVCGSLPERSGIGGDGAAFEDRRPVFSCSGDGELAQVNQQNQAIFLQVTSHLVGTCTTSSRAVVHPLDLYHAARRAFALASV